MTRILSVLFIMLLSISAYAGNTKGEATSAEGEAVMPEALAQEFTNAEMQVNALRQAMRADGKMTFKEKMADKLLKAKLNKIKKQEAKTLKKIKKGKEVKKAKVELGSLFVLVGLILVILGLVGLVVSGVGVGVGGILLGLILVLIGKLLF